MNVISSTKFFILIIVFISVLIEAVSIAVGESPWLEPESAQEWNSLMAQRSGWLAADGIYSVKNLENGDIYLLFSDTICGTTCNDGRDFNDVYMVNHTFWHLESNTKRITFYVPPQGKNLLPDRYWLQDATFLDGKLHTTGIIPDLKTWKPQRLDWLTIPILDDGTPDFEASEILHDVPIRVETERGMLVFGAAFLEDVEGYTYIFGYFDAVREFSRKDLVVARVEATRLTDFSAWRFWAGTTNSPDGWSTEIRDAVPLVRGISPEFSVSKIPIGPQRGRFLLVYTRGGISPEIEYRTATEPVGPYSDAVLFCRVPQHADGVSAYNAKGHPVLSEANSGNDALIISTNLNRLGMLPHHPEEYRPKFWRLDYRNILPTSN